MADKINREERRRTNEPCFWCDESSAEVGLGVIINESGTGILLRAAKFPEINNRICLLTKNAAEIFFETPTPKLMMEHPLARWGNAVRFEPPDLVGIHFVQEMTNHPEFHRWYRGESSLSALFDQDRVVVMFSGNLTLETVLLVQKIMGKEDNPFREILFFCHEMTATSGTALSLLRNTLMQWDKQGTVITLVVGHRASPSGALRSGLKSEHIVFINTDSRYGMPLRSFPPSPPAIPTKASDSTSSPLPKPETKSVPTMTILIIGLRLTTKTRLSLPLDRLKFKILKADNFPEAVELILKHSPAFVIADFDLDTCGSLISLNEIKKSNPARLPPLLLIGPDHIQPLAKAALCFPIGKYIVKPFTDKDYIDALETMILTAKGPTAPTEDIKVKP